MTVPSLPLEELGLPIPQTVTDPAALAEQVTSQPNSHPRWAGLQVFGSTFVTIFLAELGDKTQVTTLLMSAESHSPWVVFAGAGAALVTTSLLGVLLGQWISTRIAPKTLERAAGVTLLLISALLVWDILKG